MTSQAEKTAEFHALHRNGNPLVLINIWDPGSAAAVAAGGASALATGSASVAGAFGSSDGEAMPLELVLDNAARIVSSTSLPVSLDFEGGYARDSATLRENIRRVVATGVVGINFEDQIIGGAGLHPAEFQAERIAAARAAANACGVDLFINARTDVWLDAGRETIPETDRLDSALVRAKAYAAAGASGFFVPGLDSAEQLAAICQSTVLPVNAMFFDGMPTIEELTSLGVERISFGPGPWRGAMAALTDSARAVYQT
ncbi:isocitrate lyase/phosphoenolpyruvate mutase family protein [Blastomonas sp.]|uniref:isocitrate lyase/PEP mutase family protein n=1 Tax=Blastomonas sp. TaxID=1909299 RepID=UPI00359414EA